MNVSVLGCGRWGSFLAWYQAAVLKNSVKLWGEAGRKSFEQLKREGKNEYITLDKSIDLTSDLQSAVSSAQVIIISISAQALRSFLATTLPRTPPFSSIKSPSFTTNDL